MSVRPTLLRDIKKSAVQHHQQNTGIGNYNRYALLSPRGRIQSVGKRQLDLSHDDREQTAKQPKLDGNLVLDQLKDQEGIIKELDTLVDEITKVTVDPDPDPRIGKLCKIVKLLATSQKNITSAVIDAAKVNVSVANLNTAPGSSSQAATPAYRKKNNTVAISPPVEDPVMVATKKVKQVLREAEKKTVLFNLNLGKNPVMNKESLSRKVTESLCSTVKAGNHDYDIADAEEVLDDILSCSKLEFLGTTSKLYFNNRNENDPLNNKMYTLPVRMDFKDRETRFEAEIMLRKICKVNCSVPYPKKMRNLLNDMIKEGKALQPNSFIRTKVNVEKLTVEAHAKTAAGWVDLNIKKSIPVSILDNSTEQTLMEIGESALSQVS
jgi:hypothetical protein